MCFAILSGKLLTGPTIRKPRFNNLRWIQCLKAVKKMSSPAPPPDPKGLGPISSRRGEKCFLMFSPEEMRLKI